MGNGLFGAAWDAIKNGSEALYQGAESTPLHWLLDPTLGKQQPDGSFQGGIVPALFGSHAAPVMPGPDGPAPAPDAPADQRGFGGVPQAVPTHAPQFSAPQPIKPFDPNQPDNARAWAPDSMSPPPTAPRVPQASQSSQGGAPQRANGPEIGPDGLSKPNWWRVLDDVIQGQMTISNAYDYERMRPAMMQNQMLQRAALTRMLGSVAGDAPQGASPAGEAGNAGEPPPPPTSTAMAPPLLQDAAPRRPSGPDLGFTAPSIPGVGQASLPSVAQPAAGIPQPVSSANGGQNGGALGSSVPAVGQPFTGLPHVGLSSGQQKTLFALSMMKGDYSGAAAVMNGDVKSTDDNTLYDAHTGRVLGKLPLAPKWSVSSGWAYNERGDENPGYLPKPPVDGATPLFDQYQRFSGWHLPDGTLDAVRQTARATETGKAEATAPYTFTNVKSPDGREGPVSAARLHAGEVGGGAGQGFGGPQPGLGQSTADAAYDQASAQELSKRITGDTAAREGAITAAANAQQALSFVRSHPMNPGTPHMAEWANNLRVLAQTNPGLMRGAGVNLEQLDSAAAEPATYERLATQARLEGAKTMLPSRYTERELALLNQIYPTLSTPNEAAGTFWAQTAAMANRSRAQADFAGQYAGPKSVGAYSQAWANSPDGKRSIFQDPIWSGVTIGNRPAVVYSQKGGAKYGVFMPYTAAGKVNPNAYVFRVQ